MGYRGVFMRIYALIGSSGTGKSYRALELAYEKDIDYIIDDGLLIHKNKILAGISAKQAKTTMEAVKRAIFNDELHRQSVKLKIKSEKVENLLILGTSKKMIDKIVKRLEIGTDYKTIDIRDISSYREIEIAKESRKSGNHIIPVPSVEIKQIATGLSINSIKKLFRKKDKDCKLIEKTIIRPTFSYMGKFYISPNVIHQIIRYELRQINEIEKVNKVEVFNANNNIKIFLNVNIKSPTILKKIEEIQKKLKNNIEKVTMMNVYKIDIYINRLRKDF